MQVRRMVFVVLLIVWCIVITSFSGQTGKESAGLSEKLTNTWVHVIYEDFDMTDEEERTAIFDTWHLIIRKCAHMCEYAILAILIINVLLTFSWFKNVEKVRYLALLLVTVLAAAVFAGGDEYHQSFVAGRGPSVIDVLIDSTGALIGTSLVLLVCRIRQITTQRKEEKGNDNI